MFQPCIDKLLITNAKALWEDDDTPYGNRLVSSAIFSRKATPFITVPQQHYKYEQLGPLRLLTQTHTQNIKNISLTIYIYKKKKKRGTEQGRRPPPHPPPHPHTHPPPLLANPHY